MKRTIGLDRELKLRWLDIAAGLARAERNKLALRAQLMDALAEDIPAHFVRVKTCTVLIRTWLTVPPEHIELRDRAFDLLKVSAPDQRVVAHWGMLLLAYPFFREIVSAIGRAAPLQEEISRGQISRRVTEAWGERTTVKRSILRVFQTLTDWDVLIPNGDEDYHVAAARQIADPLLAMWLIEATVRSRGSAVPLSGLVQAPENFPFQLALTLTDMTRSERFETFREGPELLVGARYTSRK
jgi:hypothetical protein